MSRNPNLKPHVRRQPEDHGVVDDVERPVEGAEGEPGRPLQLHVGRVEDAAAGERPRGSSLEAIGKSRSSRKIDSQRLFSRE